MEEMIFNQDTIPKKQWRYGLRSSAATGCGWIATYNALRLLGYEAQPEELIRHYERAVPVVNGNFGTFLPCIVGYFKRRGFSAKTVLARKKFDQTAKESDTCILFYYWKSKWKIGAHFVTLQYRDGIFYGYNTYKNSCKADCYGPSLDVFLKRKHYVGCILIAINDQRRNKK